MSWGWNLKEQSWGFVWMNMVATQEPSYAVVVPELAFGCSFSAFLQMAEHKVLLQALTLLFGGRLGTDGKYCSPCLFACLPGKFLWKRAAGSEPCTFCKIESSAGITSAALHWFYFRLTDHKQFVYTDSFSSSTVNHNQVLQGSVPGLVVAFHLYTRLGWFRSSVFPSEFKGRWFMSFPLHKDPTKNLHYRSGRLSLALKYFIINLKRDVMTHFPQRRESWSTGTENIGVSPVLSLISSSFKGPLALMVSSYSQFVLLSKGKENVWRWGSVLWTEREKDRKMAKWAEVMP